MQSTRGRLDTCAEMYRTSGAIKGFVYMGTWVWSKLDKNYCGTKIFARRFKRYLLKKQSSQCLIILV